MKSREIPEALKEEKKIQNWNSASVGKFRPVGINSSYNGDVYVMPCRAEDWQDSEGEEFEFGAIDNNISDDDTE